MRKFIGKFKEKGQALVFYALLIPVAFCFVGAAIEFGWWYFNQSRLQNAADAAVLAGAGKIVESSDIKDAEGNKLNFIVKFVSNSEPPEPLNNLHSSETIGDVTAKKYADDNFPYVKLKDDATFFNHYFDGSLEELNPLYYVVELKGQVNHLFNIMEHFGDMDIKAVAVAKIYPNNTISVKVKDEIEKLKTANVIVGNWEVQNKYHNSKSTYDKYKNIYGETLFDGNWNHYKTSNKQMTHDKNKKFYEENLVVGLGIGNEFATPANGTKTYGADELESINIDFSQDVEFILEGDYKYFIDDWDIGYAKPRRVSAMKAINSGSITQRTHSQINFDKPYPTRSDKTYPDILWTRIESEPMWSKLGFQTQRTLNAVRQIILNVNVSNMGEAYRPLVIFYDGPETNSKNPNLTEEERKSVNSIRLSQPVILNLNADFSGILYAPNSPVVLNNPNDHDFKGFIVAKEYLSLKTESDFYQENGKYYDSSSKTTEYFKTVYNHDINGTSKKITNTVFVDSIGNVQYKPYTGNFKCGTYESFGQSGLDETFFTTDNDMIHYDILKDSANNLLIVGNGN